MTNLDKYKEVFGDDWEDSKVSDGWLLKTYNGPVKATDKDKFIAWLKREPLIRFDNYMDDEAFPRIYISDLTDKPILRVSGFDNKGRVHVDYEGLSGTLCISHVKELIKRSVDIRITDYEKRSKADMVAMLEEYDLSLSGYEDADLIRVDYIRQDIQEKIDALKGGQKL